MTQNFSDSSKQYMLRRFSEWATEYLKQGKGFTNQTWYYNLSKVIELDEAELDHFLRTWAKADYDAFKQCMDNKLLSPSKAQRDMRITLHTGLEEHATTDITIKFPIPMPILFGSEHNHYYYSNLYESFPELREALPARVIEAFDEILSLQQHASMLRTTIKTYTRARQLLDQLPTFLRFMPASIRDEMRVTNIRRAMRSDTQKLPHDTIVFFAIMNLIQPMDE